MNLLLEVGTEELPPASVVPALEYMAAEFANRAAIERLSHSQIETFGTPRRLALRVSGLADRTPDVEETRMGPSVAFAYDADKRPTKAALGFAKGQGVDVHSLIRIVTDKGEYVGARLVHKGRPAVEVLPALLVEVLRTIPWEKSMRWGWGTDSWARPVHWICALCDSEVLPLTFAGVDSGKHTYGHRFASPRPVKVPTPAAYEAILKKAFVVPDVQERRAEIVRLATEAAAPHRLVVNEGLLDEVTQLVEYPVCARGQFDEKFLALPRPVLISEMREHQRYFALENERGKLVNAFVVVLNTPVKDLAAVVKGNERVLVARLADGRFFLQRDKERTLSSRVADLEKLVFLEQLGSMRAKSIRVEVLATYLSAMLFPRVSRWARRAAYLCKNDLTSEMVVEFPELQGVMGREYALADGEPEEVAEAIAEHYRPRGASDAVPQTPTGIVVAIADKIDSIAACFAVGLQPTGATDPYGLRRAAIGIVRITLEHELKYSLDELITAAVNGITGATRPAAQVCADIGAFFRRRLKASLADDTTPTDVVEAVLQTGIDDLVATAAKVRALQSMRDNDDFAPLAAAFKRVANMLKNESPAAPLEADLFETEAERALWGTYTRCWNRVSDQLKARDYQGAASTLIELKEPIDRFFDDVLVMAEDPAVRTNRLGMLRDLRLLFEQIGDISRIQVEG